MSKVVIFLCDRQNDIVNNHVNAILASLVYYDSGISTLDIRLVMRDESSIWHVLVRSIVTNVLLGDTQ